MHVERVARLVEVLDEVARCDAPFDIKRWACGTTACALGWAARDPRLNREGLRLRPHSVQRCRLDGCEEPYFSDHSGYHLGYDAASAFFGVDIAMAFDWFSPINYPKCPFGEVTARDVRDKVAAALKRHVCDGVES